MSLKTYPLLPLFWQFRSKKQRWWSKTPKQTGRSVLKIWHSTVKGSVSSAVDNGIQCDACNCWLHGTHDKTAKSFHKIYGKHKSRKWFCSGYQSTVIPIGYGKLRVVGNEKPEQGIKSLCVRSVTVQMTALGITTGFRLGRLGANGGEQALSYQMGTEEEQQGHSVPAHSRWEFGVVVEQEG